MSLQLRFWSTTVGRDKTYRTVQYAARFLAWYEYRKGRPEALVTAFTALKSQLGLSRKRKSTFLGHSVWIDPVILVVIPIVTLTLMARLRLRLRLET